MKSEMNFWTVVLPLWGFCAFYLLGIWLYFRRKRKQDRIKYASPAELDPASAGAKEAAILLGREMYERGDFKRRVVGRVPYDLFSDEFKLECGHTALAIEKDAHEANCYTCARAWIETQSKVKLNIR